MRFSLYAINGTRRWHIPSQPHDGSFLLRLRDIIWCCVPRDYLRRVINWWRMLWCRVPNHCGCWSGSCTRRSRGIGSVLSWQFWCFRYQYSRNKGWLIIFWNPCNSSKSNQKENYKLQDVRVVWTNNGNASQQGHKISPCINDKRPYGWLDIIFERAKRAYLSSWQTGFKGGRCWSKQIEWQLLRRRSIQTSFLFLARGCDRNIETRLSLASTRVRLRSIGTGTANIKATAIIMILYRAWYDGDKRQLELVLLLLQSCSFNILF